MAESSENGQKEKFDWAPLRAQAEPIMEVLGETKRIPRMMIERIIRLRGVEFAQALLEETLKIESEGGMMTLDGSRRRTTGGVYFRLARQQLAGKDKQYVFYTLYPGQKKKKRKTDAAEKNNEQPESEDQPKPEKQDSPQQKPEAKVQVESAQPEPKPELKPDPEAKQQEIAESPEMIQLRKQADELRQKIAEHEASGKSGVKLLRMMLKKVEAQLE